jgi:hypothetical protein
MSPPPWLLTSAKLLMVEKPNHGVSQGTVWTGRQGWVGTQASGLSLV